MDFYDVEVDCMAYCYGGNPKFTVEPYGYGEWAKREDVDVLIAERDRLAAENAEFRKTVTETEQACNELSDELSQMYQLELEAKCHGDLEESHKIMVDVVAERDAELATDYAALEAERDEWKRKYDEVNKSYTGLVDLLLPKLKEAQALAIAEGRDNG